MCFKIKTNKENAMSLNTWRDHSKTLAQVKKGEYGEKQSIFPVVW